MTRKYLWLVLCSAFLLIAACQKAPELTLTGSSNIELSVDGSSATITFTANRDWRVSSSDSWVSVSPSSGTASDGPVSVTVRCNANTTYDDRTATVTITMEELSQAITVRQPANLGIILPSQSFDLQSDARSIEVEVKSNVEYSVETSVDWIKQTGTKGLTSKTLTFSIEENKTYDPREGKITIKSKVSSVPDQVISVKQAQKDAIIVEKTSYDMPYGGGEIEIKVEANVGFDVTPDSEWLHHVSTKALSSSTVLIKVDENETYNARNGKVEITQQNGSIKHTIAINQAGRIAVTSVELSNTELTLMVGSTETLVATVKPDDATDKTVTWTSSDDGVATVDERGLVTAIGDGSATISAKAGDVTATCIVTVISIPENAIDLGIYVTRTDGTSYKVYWADCNIGASKPEEYGDYYAWGEIETKAEYSWSNYKWATNGDINNLTKYCQSDNKTVLDSEDDVAYVKLGGRWRMPTSSDWAALLTQGAWRWTIRDGIEGIEVYRTDNVWNGNQIFLPYNLAEWNGEVDGYYYTSNRHGDRPWAAIVRYYTGSSFYGKSFERCHGALIRPVYVSEDIVVDAFTLNKTEMDLWVFDKETLTASIVMDGMSPSIPVIWSSSDPTIASVSPEGMVTAYNREGTTIITAKTGGKTAECIVTVKKKTPVYVGNAVDLGVVVTRSDGTTYKLLWADCNLGTDKPEEYGEYYAWGETESKDDYSWATYKFRTSGDYIGNLQFSKYNTDMFYGPVDNKTVLEPEDDVAHVRLGGKWRIPTEAEQDALCGQCTWARTTKNGVSGYEVKSKENSNSIFLPAAGDRRGSSRYGAESSGVYWSSALLHSSPVGASRVSFFSDSGVSRGSLYRCYGASVRPVMEE